MADKMYEYRDGKKIKIRGGREREKERERERGKLHH